MHNTQDPRISKEFIREIATDSSDITVLGVVHDHPASIYRVRNIVREMDPSVLALELPPLAIPLYKQYAETTDSTSQEGGEMSAAIASANGAEVAGIDGPTVEFTRWLYSTLREEGVSWKSIYQNVKAVANTIRPVFLARLKGVLHPMDSTIPDFENRVTHSVTTLDEPTQQAEDERRQIHETRALMNALAPSRSASLRDTVREQYMAYRIAALATNGPVVAIVGLGHLDSIARELSESHNV